MTYGMILTALADPTRRTILDRMRQGPLPVGKIAEPLPVSRPAVSQHLRVLVDAGLVSMTKDGRRNLYGLVNGGAGPLVDWLGDLSAKVEPTAETGLSRSVTVRLNPAETWQLFCEDLALWWPVAVVSLSARSEGALPQAVTTGAEDGAVWTEVLFDGTTGTWARVTEVVPGQHLTLDWRLGAEDGSVVTVRFQPEGAGTRLTLTHDADTPEMADMWDLVLMERFAASAASSLSNF
ncbi:metalloregulator ArsR/SmtB family transcription factor [Jannaschia sp. 2305UL9-9]|uniref:ArsR/SmtB family transcription factor n=1 Tax=Jannaschia sp. 2305UL9-9 TaxID=3121638 RepID=UPI0035283715